MTIEVLQVLLKIYLEPKRSAFSIYLLHVKKKIFNAILLKETLGNGFNLKPPTSKSHISVKCKNE